MTEISILCVPCNQIMNNTDHRNLVDGFEEDHKCGTCNHKVVVRASEPPKLVKNPSIKDVILDETQYNSPQEH